MDSRTGPTAVGMGRCTRARLCRQLGGFAGGVSPGALSMSKTGFCATPLMAGLRIPSAALRYPALSAASNVAQMCLQTDPVSSNHGQLQRTLKELSSISMKTLYLAVP